VLVDRDTDECEDENHEVKNIRSVPQVSSGLHNKTVSYDLDASFTKVDDSEEIRDVLCDSVQRHVLLRVVIQGNHDAVDEDNQHDEVIEPGVVADGNHPHSDLALAREQVK
jgi:hypothetical protein